MAASAALLPTHERGILSKRRLKINREHGLDMGGDFSFFQVLSHRLEAVFAAIWPAANGGDLIAILPHTCILMVETAPARRNFAP
jgi:pyruvate dehydrogenase complex dehydrogenase (E1) component